MHDLCTNLGVNMHTCAHASLMIYRFMHVLVPCAATACAPSQQLALALEADPACGLVLVLAHRPHRSDRCRRLFRVCPALWFVLFPVCALAFHAAVPQSNELGALQDAHSAGPGGLGQLEVPELP